MASSFSQEAVRPPNFLIWRGKLRLAACGGEFCAPAKLAYDGALRLNTLDWLAKPVPRQIFSFFLHPQALVKLV